MDVDLTYENLSYWRKTEKLTYKQIADLVEVSEQTVAKYCRDNELGAKNGIVNTDKSKKYAIDKIIDYFATMQKGERVKQSAIYKELEMNARTFRRQSETKRFTAAMEKYGITKEKTFYIKEI